MLFCGATEIFHLFNSILQSQIRLKCEIFSTHLPPPRCSVTQCSGAFRKVCRHFNLKFPNKHPQNLRTVVRRLTLKLVKISTTFWGQVGFGKSSFLLDRSAKKERNTFYQKLTNTYKSFCYTVFTLLFNIWLPKKSFSGKGFFNQVFMNSLIVLRNNHTVCVGRRESIVVYRSATKVRRPPFASYGALFFSDRELNTSKVSRTGPPSRIRVGKDPRCSNGMPSRTLLSPPPLCTEWCSRVGAILFVFFHNFLHSDTPQIIWATKAQARAVFATNNPKALPPPPCRVPFLYYELVLSLGLPH